MRFTLLKRLRDFLDLSLVAPNGRNIGHKPLFSIFIFIFINWFTECHKVVTSGAPFLPRDGLNHTVIHFTYPRRDGQAEWAWVAWMNTRMIDPPKVVTNPFTNRASLMWWTALPLHHTGHLLLCSVLLPPLSYSCTCVLLSTSSPDLYLSLLGFLWFVPFFCGHVASNWRSVCLWYRLNNQIKQVA